LGLRINIIISFSSDKTIVLIEKILEVDKKKFYFMEKEWVMQNTNSCKLTL